MEEKEGMGDLLARAINLEGLADYQGGAVVSRTIIKKQAGTVTFFAFDEGQDGQDHQTGRFVD